MTDKEMLKILESICKVTKTNSDGSVEIIYQREKL